MPHNPGQDLAGVVFFWAAARPMGRAEDFLIVGASARAAAFSALRAGLAPWCVDLFADADLQARCPARAVQASRYPGCLRTTAAEGPPGPWIFTGALENHPGLVQSLAQTRPLWGNSAPALRKARSPDQLARIFQEAAIPAPWSWQAARRQPVVGCGGLTSRRSLFLLKPLKGSAGRRIRLAPADRAPEQGYYLQELIEGDAHAAIYLGDGKTAHLLGSTRQLVGLPWLHAGPFSYCGNIGPLKLDPAIEQRLGHIGHMLAEKCGLHGLFGVDLILRVGIPWPVEVNPRYTASVEVLEYATGMRTLQLQQAVSEGATLPKARPLRLAADMVGKAILFARRSFTFPADGPWWRVLTHPVSVEELPTFADLPHVGQRIRAGSPILTFFARGPSVQSCEERLRQRARDLDRWLFGP
jgi:predicted ATP-grasp superfamily ATP-dependent carboligase